MFEALEREAIMINVSPNHLSKINNSVDLILGRPRYIQTNIYRAFTSSTSTNLYYGNDYSTIYGLFCRFCLFDRHVFECRN